MKDSGENPLDILDGDGDDAVEMSILFDDDGKGKQGCKKPNGKSGCCVMLLGLVASIGTSVYLLGL